MRALMAQKERFTVHVRPEQVDAALGADGGEPVGEGTVVEALERPPASQEPLAIPARDAWAAAGVVLSNVASTVVCLGFPAQISAPAREPTARPGRRRRSCWKPCGLRALSWS